MSVEVLPPSLEQPLRIPMSRAEYDAMPETEQLFEWVDGEAIELIAPIPHHADATSELIFAIKFACRQLRVLSTAALDMPNSIRVPDIMVVPDYPSDAKRIVEPALVAIEVLSPSTWREDLRRKPAEYGAFGVQ